MGNTIVAVKYFQEFMVGKRLFGKRIDAALLADNGVDTPTLQPQKPYY